MQIQVTVPGLLSESVGGERHFYLQSATLAQALRQLSKSYPRLHAHIYDEAGKIRNHVLIYYNDQSVLWLDSLDIPLKSGDRLQIIQAVSGG